MSQTRQRPPGKGRPTPSRRQQRVAAARQARRRDRLTWGLVGLGVLALVGIFAGAVLSSADGGGDGTVDHTAFDLPALGDDGRVRLADFEGTPVVVNFFASWCDACDFELPFFEAAAESLEGRVAFVFVNSNETGDWRPMAERHGIERFTVARDIKGTRGNGLYRSMRAGSGGMPVTAFYAADGTFLEVHRGALDGTRLDAKLRQHFGLDV